MRGLRVMKNGECIARTTLWIVDTVGTHTVVAIPRLHLTQELAMLFAAGKTYADVFSGATIALEGQPEQNFVVVHASLDLYRTGDPDISSFAVFIPNAVPPPSWGAVISKTANMLRGFNDGCSTVPEKVAQRSRQSP